MMNSVGRRGGAGPDGVVLLDKPLGMTSNAALTRVRRLFGAARAGHTGSLDPLATGLLPICLGRATRLSGYLLDARKAYRVVGRLGERTTTGDAEGEIAERCAWERVDRAVLERSLASFRGRILQVPPMYSALKQGGERLYRKARRGEKVVREPRPVQISRLELERFEPPEFHLDVECSKGTYIRTLVEDVARAAGSCAHVTGLRRYAAGPYDGRGMHALAELETLAEQGTAALADVLLPSDSALAGMPAVTVEAADAARLEQGQAIASATGPAGIVRLYGPRGFMGIGARTDDGRLAPRRLMGGESET